jgi:hypothetical protein
MSYLLVSINLPLLYLSYKYYSQEYHSIIIIMDLISYKE